MDLAKRRLNSRNSVITEIESDDASHCFLERHLVRGGKKFVEHISSSSFGTLSLKIVFVLSFVSALTINFIYDYFGIL